jgi:hypothetical protein
MESFKVNQKVYDKRTVNTKWATIDKTSPTCLSLSVSHSVFSDVHAHRGVKHHLFDICHTPTQTQIRFFVIVDTPRGIQLHLSSNPSGLPQSSPCFELLKLVFSVRLFYLCV